MAPIFKDKLICLVTGASQNVGAAFAQAFVSKLAPGSILILSSRSKERLGSSLQDLMKKAENIVKIVLVEWDLNKPNADRFKTDLKNAIKGSDLSGFQGAVIVHNAFGLGDMSKKVVDFQNVAELQDLMNVNLVSPLVINSAFLEVMKPIGKKIVVNVTAPSATKPLPSFGQTALGKCPFYMAMNILAKENPDIRVVHFDPGMIDTDGLRTIRDTSFYEEIRHWVTSLYDKGELLAPSQTAEALMMVLEKDEFASGDNISAFTVLGIKK